MSKLLIKKCEDCDCSGHKACFPLCFPICFTGSNRLYIIAKNLVKQLCKSSNKTKQTITAENTNKQLGKSGNTNKQLITGEKE